MAAWVVVQDAGLLCPQALALGSSLENAPAAAEAVEFVRLTAACVGLLAAAVEEDESLNTRSNYGAV